MHGGPDADGVRVQVVVLAGFRAASDLVVDPVHSERQEQFRFLSFIPPLPPPLPSTPIKSETKLTASVLK